VNFCYFLLKYFVAQITQIKIIGQTGTSG